MARFQAHLRCVLC